MQAKHVSPIQSEVKKEIQVNKIKCHAEIKNKREVQRQGEWKTEVTIQKSGGNRSRNEATGVKTRNPKTDRYIECCTDNRQAAIN